MDQDQKYVYVIAFDPHDGFWWAMERGNNARASAGITPLDALRDLLDQQSPTVNDACSQCGYVRGAHGTISTTCPNGKGLFQALTDIADASWQNWSPPYNTPEEFAAWAKNVARTAIAKAAVSAEQKEATA